jgi:beta,beta-carotene 9',10'-dioxygenase
MYQANPRPPFTIGFTTLSEETPQPVALPLRGHLPSWLEGFLLRTGPACFEVGGRPFNHWFDGLAMLHRFRIAGGSVTYANRFLRSAAYRAAERDGTIAYREFATDPCASLFGWLKAFFVAPKLTDNANVSVQALDGRVAALTETPFAVEFDPETLETLHVRGFDPKLDGHLTIAHPHYDFREQCQYSYILKFGRHSRYRVFRTLAETGRHEPVSELPVDRPAYMHSIGMTANYLILAEFPLVVDPLRLRFSGRPFIENYRWEPERGLRFRIIEKDSGRVVRDAMANACFAFHHVNAFEGDGRVVIDIVTYPDAQIMQQLYLNRLRAGLATDTTGRLTRFEIPLSDGDPPIARTIADHSFDLPRINYARIAGRPYRFVWGSGDLGGHDFSSRIVKIDVTTGQTVIWQEESCHPGEPVFVASPDSASEDGGVLLSVVLDAVKGTSFLLVLDATTLIERARAEVPHHIPFHFHGNFLPFGCSSEARSWHS